MKININELKSFLKRIEIDKMITELPVKIENDIFEILTTNKTKEVVAHGKLTLIDPIEKAVQISFPNLTKFIAILDEFDVDCDLTIQNGFATFMDSEKAIKTEVIQSSLFSSINANVKFNKLSIDCLELEYKGKHNYSDYISFNGKEFKKILDKCKIVASPFFLIEQINDELIFKVESKKDSIKFKCDFKSKFKEDKVFWLVDFTKEIFKKNQIECRMFINDKNSPIIIDTSDINGSYNYITFLVAPRVGI